MYYNSVILSEVLSTLESHAYQPAIEILQRVTPLAWQHINFYGRYRFEGDLRSFNIAKMAAELAQSDSNRWGMTA